MNRHPIDIFSLGAGLAFLGIAIAVLLGERFNYTVNAALLFPLLLIGLGVLGLVSALRQQRSATDDQLPPDSDLREATEI